MKSTLMSYILREMAKEWILMFIKNCMTPTDQLILTYPNTLVKDALSLMNRFQLQSLPVVDDSHHFIGMVSKSNLFMGLEKGQYVRDWEQFLNTPILTAVDEKVPLLTLDSKFEDTLPVIVYFPFVPLVDEQNRLLGIVKRSNINHALEDAFGMSSPGLRLLIGMVETSGQLDKLQHIIYNMGLNVVTNITFDAGNQYLRRVVVKVSPISEKKKQDLESRLTSAGFKILTIDEEK